MSRNVIILRGCLNKYVDTKLRAHNAFLE